MKIVTPQILWHSDEHNKAAALTGVDCCRCRRSGSVGDEGATSSSSSIVVTSANTDGGDAVHLWKLLQTSQQQQPLQFLYALNRHGDDEPVGGVRFSPNGLHLAVAGGGATKY